MRIAITQSNYIPWKGYFDIIRSVDEFVLYDNVQYTRRDWRNRNLIKTASGVKWITIPVDVKGKYYQAINETKVSDHNWNKEHFNKLCYFYKDAPFFKKYKPWLENLYLKNVADMTHLSKINHAFITAINEILNIETKISFSSDFSMVEGKNERLISICKATGASTYLSGKAAKNYLDISLFKNEKINVEWMEYPDYSSYPQLHGSFCHQVTILDLIFNTGPNAIEKMKNITTTS